MMKLDHIALYVKNLESARTFFMHYFGATSTAGRKSDRDNGIEG